MFSARRGFGVTFVLSIENTAFVLEQLVVRDFKIRYRNMSLGLLWSLVNPLVMVAVYSFVMTNMFPNVNIKHFPLFALCGIICFNFFSLAWSQGTISVTANSFLMKRIPFPREIVPISVVLANGIHFLMQFALVLVFTLAGGLHVSASWLWLPVPILILMLSAVGLALLFSVADVFLRDTRYLVESACLVLFWLTPIFYSEKMVPVQYKALYMLSPITAAVVCLRQIVLEMRAPDISPLVNGFASATFLLAIGFVGKLTVALGSSAG